MGVIQRLLVLGALLVNMVLSDFQCCMKELVNGSVSYTLNNGAPNHWTRSWNIDGFVIVDEDGKTHKDYVVCKIENGCILYKKYPDITCRLESPENGVSEEIHCTAAQCEPTSPSTAPGGIITSYLPHILIGGASVFLLFMAGFLVQRSRHRGNGTDIELQPVQNQDQDQNQDDPDHQRAAE